MKISTFVNRRLNSNIAYLNSFNKVTKENLVQLLEENHVNPPVVDRKTANKLIQEVFQNYDMPLEFEVLQDSSRVMIMDIVQQIVDKEYNLAVQNKVI